MMKSCKTCAFALDYELSPACEKCFHHSNWLEKVKEESIPMTNGDHIRSMSDEELAKWLDKIVVNCHKDCCEGCPLEAACYGNGTLEFLKQPWKENE